MDGGLLQIGLATEADLPGILELQAANQMSHGGMLSADLPVDSIRQNMKLMPLIVARRGDRVVGFLMSSPKDLDAEVPVVRATLKAYSGAPDAYLYGPICVDDSERGHGLAEKMFAKLRSLEPGREGILFIRDDNGPSLVAHRKMGMREVARFALEERGYAVFAYVG